jgi:hypothetical protein
MRQPSAAFQRTVGERKAAEGCRSPKPGGIFVSRFQITTAIFLNHSRMVIPPKMGLNVSRGAPVH